MTTTPSLGQSFLQSGTTIMPFNEERTTANTEVLRELCQYGPFRDIIKASINPDKIIGQITTVKKNRIILSVYGADRKPIPLPLSEHDDPRILHSVLFFLDRVEERPNFTADAATPPAGREGEPSPAPAALQQRLEAIQAQNPEQTELLRTIRELFTTFKETQIGVAIQHRKEIEALSRALQGRASRRDRRDDESTSSSSDDSQRPQRRRVRFRGGNERGGQARLRDDRLRTLFRDRQPGSPQPAPDDRRRSPPPALAGSDDDEPVVDRDIFYPVDNGSEHSPRPVRYSVPPRTRPRDRDEDEIEAGPQPPPISRSEEPRLTDPPLHPQVIHRKARHRQPEPPGHGRAMPPRSAPRSAFPSGPPRSSQPSVSLGTPEESLVDSPFSFEEQRWQHYGQEPVDLSEEAEAFRDIHNMWAPLRRSLRQPPNPFARPVPEDDEPQPRSVPIPEPHPRGLQPPPSRTLSIRRVSVEPSDAAIRRSLRAQANWALFAGTLLERKKQREEEISSDDGKGSQSDGDTTATGIDSPHASAAASGKKKVQTAPSRLNWLTSLFRK